MRSLNLLARTLLLAGIQAATLRMQVITEQPSISYLLQKRSFEYKQQSPISDSSEELRSPLHPSSTYSLLTTLSLGHPPQTFKTTLSFLTNDLFILSSLNKAPEFKSNTHYNSSLSSTYTPNGTSIDVSFLSVGAKGFASRDHVSIAGLKLKDWLFGEAVILEYGNGVSPWDLEAFLGLGPPRSLNSSLGSPNLVSEMYKRGLIPEETFSITYPRLEGEAGEEKGSLVFGEGTDGLKMLGVTKEKMSFAGEEYAAWGVVVKEVRLGDGTSISTGPLKHATAWVQSEMMWIGLPGSMVDELHEYMDAHRLGWSPLFTLDCTRRASFPDLVFTLGEEEEEVRISSFDYTFVTKDDDGGPDMCFSMLMEGQDDAVALGAGFLRGVKSYFDVGAGKLGFREIDHKF